MPKLTDYATAEFESWTKPGPVKCSCCDRPGAVIHTLMSREHPTCKVCHWLWYDCGYTNPIMLREKSLGPEGLMIERGLSENPSAPKEAAK